MKYLLVGALLFSIDAAAFAQAVPNPAAPTVGAKKLVQVKPAAPAGCKIVGTVRGTKLWAGECVANDNRDAATESAASPPSAPVAEVKP
jgi:hypothetical protein